MVLIHRFSLWMIFFIYMGQEENWNDGSKTYIFDWASALTTGQIEFLYGNKETQTVLILIKHVLGLELIVEYGYWRFSSNNNQWYNFVITRSQKFQNQQVVVSLSLQQQTLVF